MALLSPGENLSVWVEMTYESLADGGLNYFPCRYGKSRLLFRGPRRKLEGVYSAVIGGTETYGKFVLRPYPDMLEDHIGMTVVNFGAVNAGVDVFMGDADVLEACRGARAVVIQIMGAHNLSNRYYSVHPRRNDRFLKASPLLRMLYPEVDFTDFNFTRHLVQSLHEADPRRFLAVRAELEKAWTHRMVALIRQIEGTKILLWMAERQPEDPVEIHKSSDPLFVNRKMLDMLRGEVAAVVEAIPDAAILEQAGEGMVFTELEAPAASEVPNASAHAMTAEALAQGLRPYI